MITAARLLLHVGYGKTGSTYLQRRLSLHRPELFRAGVCFPYVVGSSGDSGNGHLLEPMISGRFTPLELSTGLPLLFSREQLARELSAPSHCARVSAWADGRVSVLLFVRDPQEHCYSLWAQKVKRAGERRSLAAFAASYDAITMATRFIMAALAQGWGIRVLDYGKHRRGLWPALLGWLPLAEGHGVGDQALPGKLDARVNPTPAHGQLRLQRRLHAVWKGGKAPLPPHWLGHALNPPHGQVRFERAVLARWLDEVEDFNAILQSQLPGQDAMPMQEGVLINQQGVRLCHGRMVQPST